MMNKIIFYPSITVICSSVIDVSSTISIPHAIHTLTTKLDNFVHIWEIMVSICEMAKENWYILSRYGGLDADFFHKTDKYARIGEYNIMLLVLYMKMMHTK
jgi:diacylglycerol kinase family enzyme